MYIELYHNTLMVNTSALHLRTSLIVYVIAAYLDPQAPIGEKRLEGIFQSHSPPFLLTGDFISPDPIWGMPHMNCRGRSLTRVADLDDLSKVNDGTSSYVCSKTYSSCLNFTFVLSSMFSSWSWFLRTWKLV